MACMRQGRQIRFGPTRRPKLLSLRIYFIFILSGDRNDVTWVACQLTSFSPLRLCGEKDCTSSVFWLTPLP